MPSATTQVHGPGQAALTTADIDWGGSSIYVALFSSSWTPNPDTDDFLNDIVANEVTGTNWAANGQALGSMAVNVDTTNNEVEVRSADVSVATVTLTGGKNFALINRTPGSDATRHIIASGVFDTALAPQGGTLLLDVNATEGWFKYTY